LTRAKGAAALVLLGVAALWLFSWYRSPERRIHRSIAEIEKLVAKAPGEDNLTALGKARKIGELFAEEFEFEAQPFDFSTRDRQRLTAAIHQYRSRSQAIAVEIRDRETSVDPQQGRGTSHLTVEFLTKFQDLAGREAYRFQINWVEEGGEWRIDYVRLLEVIDAPSGPGS
jgi:hypothetical protein